MYMNFFDELKRRNVIKATIAYIVVAWVLFQVLTSVLPNFGAPPWVLKTLMFLIAIGLPIWIIFSWVYEITPEGLKKTLQVSKEQSITEATNKRLNIIIIITLIIAIAVSFVNKPMPNTSSKTMVNNGLMLDNSIAVIPFKNWSGDPELEYVSDGMTDAVISRLTKIQSINRVIPFTSMAKFKETDKSIPEIAKELGVTNILQGNFQLSGDHLKINVQLIDGLTDKHFWSDEYSGVWEIKEIFKIQSEVAENVAKNINAEIKEEEFEAIRAVSTQNKEAYRLALQADFQGRKRTINGMKNAIVLYEKAIALDSTFYEAYVDLAFLYIIGGTSYAGFNEQEAWTNSKQLLLKAVQIDSTDPTVIKFLNSGSFSYEWDFDLMEKEYMNSIYGTFYLILTGKYEEALPLINQNIENNPTRGFLYTQKAQALYFLNRKEEAIELLKSNEGLYSDNIDFLREAAKYYYYIGEYKSSKSLLTKLMNSFSDRTPMILWLIAVHEEINGNIEGANKYLSELQDKYEKEESGSPAWFIALYYCHSRDYENAFTWLQKSYERHEVEMIWLREEPLLIPLRNDKRYLELYAKVGFTMEPHRTSE